MAPRFFLYFCFIFFPAALPAPKRWSLFGGCVSDAVTHVAKPMIIKPLAMRPAVGNSCREKNPAAISPLDELGPTPVASQALASAPISETESGESSNNSSFSDNGSNSSSESSLTSAGSTGSFKPYCSKKHSKYESDSTDASSSPLSARRTNGKASIIISERIIRPKRVTFAPAVNSECVKKVFRELHERAVCLLDTYHYFAQELPERPERLEDPLCRALGILDTAYGELETYSHDAFFVTPDVYVATWNKARADVNLLSHALRVFKLQCTKLFDVSDAAKQLSSLPMPSGFHIRHVLTRYPHMHAWFGVAKNIFDDKILLWARDLGMGEIESPATSPALNELLPYKTGIVHFLSTKECPNCGDVQSYKDFKNPCQICECDQIVPQGEPYYPACRQLAYLKASIKICSYMVLALQAYMNGDLFKDKNFQNKLSPSFVQELGLS